MCNDPDFFDTLIWEKICEEYAAKFLTVLLIDEGNINQIPDYSALPNSIASPT